MTTKQIGLHIRARIDESPHTLEQCAARAGITRGTVYAIIKGRNCSLNSLIALADVLNLELIIKPKKADK